MMRFDLHLCRWKYLLFVAELLLLMSAVSAFSTTAMTQTPVFQNTQQVVGAQEVSNASARLDPLLTSFLLRSVRRIDEDESDEDDESPVIDSVTPSSYQITFSDASRAMIGLTTWESSLRKARTPIVDDFNAIDQSVWPEEPLFSNLCNTLAELGLPRLVRRHPEILTSVLLGVAKLVFEYTVAQKQGKLVIVEESVEYDDDSKFMVEDNDENEIILDEFEYEPLSNEELEKLAESLAGNLVNEWGNLVQGMSLLDKVFGYNHGLLDVQGQVGFGIEDGVWKHSGWETLPDLQQKLSSMPELRDLLSRLGRRPSSEGQDIRKFQCRKLSNSKDDMVGVQIDPSNPSSVNGLTTSGSFSAMLPSEAVLLKSSFPSLRWLFLSKKVEEKLLSYEYSGYTDVPTLPLQTKRSERLPCQAGGPLVTCLDTSWSMSGIREQLSKAVVLASVTAAHSQKRECRIVSFSSANNAIDSGAITCDADGVKRMLDFLSYSFGGGSDVTGALKYAMETLDMTSSDLLLVTDGELPNPPVSTTCLSQLETLRHQTGMEVHGLLIGKRESSALDSLCTEVHHFLVDYEMESIPHQSNKSFSSTALSMNHSSRKSGYFDRFSSGRYNFALRAMSKSDHDLGNYRLYKRDRCRGYEEDDEDLWSYDGGYSVSTATIDVYEEEEAEPVELDAYTSKVQESFERIQQLALSQIKAQKQVVAEELREELEQKSNMREVLAKSISFVETGLVERGIESRLVILALISQEHVLFVGPPGTSKSVIGKKLSELCGGPFFQRLLTKFTTPDEIFGPLSLKALENDEYVRCIDGFLPTATVAFLDEIFKANSAILNTLLTILNERQFDNGAGSRRVDCPLKCVIGASNELPESEELDALLDRFLLRAQVSPVSDDGLLDLLSSSQSSNEDELINERNYSDVLDEVFRDVSASLPDIAMNQNIAIFMKDVRNYVTDTLGQYVSDRRLVKAARLLRVCATTHGRKQVDLTDVLLLQHMLWTYPQQKDALREFIIDNLTPKNDIVDQSKFLLDGLAREALTMTKKTMGDVTGESGARNDDLDVIKSIVTEANKIKGLLEQHSNHLERHIALLNDLDNNNIWITQDEAQSVKQNCLPLAVAASDVTSAILNDAATLSLALAADVIDDELRSSVIELIIGSDTNSDPVFSDEELQMSLKEAKRIFKGDELKQWKRAKKTMT